MFRPACVTILPVVQEKYKDQTIKCEYIGYEVEP
jgi:hypothetical protein